MDNVAYTKEYIFYYEDVGKYLFEKENFQSEECRALSDSLLLISENYYKYDAAHETYPYNLRGSKNQIANKSGGILYEYRCIDCAGSFCALISHRNGKNYIVFRRDLYGYSVLELSSMKDFHYFPAESFPQGETFIWCDVNYNKANSIIAAAGCFWAAPSSVLLADLSNPMQPAAQIDIGAKINAGYEKYGDIDFVAWEGTDLILEAECNKTEKKERLIIKENEYLSMIRII